MKCDGRLCTSYDVKFNCCMTCLFLIADFNMSDTCMGCHHMGGKDPSNISTKEKRFVLHW